MKLSWVTAFTFSLLLLPARAAGPGCPQDDSMANRTMPVAKRAEIIVVPQAIYERDRIEVARMQVLLAELQLTAPRVSAPDRATQRYVELSAELATLVSAHLDRLLTTKGRSQTAIAVQTHLNRMEGNSMCGACHGGMGMQMLTPAVARRR